MWFAYGMILFTFAWLRIIGLQRVPPSVYSMSLATCNLTLHVPSFYHTPPAHVCAQQGSQMRAVGSITVDNPSVDVDVLKLTD